MWKGNCGLDTCVHCCIFVLSCESNEEWWIQLNSDNNSITSYRRPSHYLTARKACLIIYTNDYLWCMQFLFSVKVHTEQCTSLIILSIWKYPFWKCELAVRIIYQTRTPCTILYEQLRKELIILMHQVLLHNWDLLLPSQEWPNKGVSGTQSRKYNWKYEESLMPSHEWLERSHFYLGWVIFT